ncbi:MAG: hypothetical protein IT559_03245 [Alphaproteobacteria bacterium]|nr:hypothetical protein [Alphaproteobacteria bacterium]
MTQQTLTDVQNYYGKILQTNDNLKISACYDHVAYYKGTIAECPHSFVLDDHHEFKTGQPVPVCGNTANMLKNTRFAEHFRVEGNFSTHYGVFDCAPEFSGTNTGVCC